MGITRDIVSKASKDESFRQRLLTDPRAAIEKEFGVALPAGMKINVHENSSDVINLVIPGTAEAQRSLSSEELERVAGGMKANTTKSFVTLPCTNTQC